jgi:hypothetical protein
MDSRSNRPARFFPSGNGCITHAMSYVKDIRLANWPAKFGARRSMVLQTKAVRTSEQQHECADRASRGGDGQRESLWMSRSGPAVNR